MLEREYRRGNQMENPETHWTQDTERSQTKQKHNTICAGHHY